MPVKENVCPQQFSHVKALAKIKLKMLLRKCSIKELRRKCENEGNVSRSA